MSIQLMTWVWNHSPMSGTGLLIHLCLADFANDDGYCWPSQQTVATKARCTDRYVRQIVAELESKGMLRIERSKNGIDSNRYWVETPNSEPRNTVPPPSEFLTPRNPSSATPGTPVPTNHKEPSMNHQEVERCVWCKTRLKGNKHYCSPMNMYVRH